MTSPQDTKHTPLCPILNEIVKAAESGFPFIAIAMTLALPDICASLASDDGRSNSDRYREWCKKFLPWDKFTVLTPDDLWSMRCGVLHNGRFGDLKHSVGKVIFMLPGGHVFQDCQSNDAYLYTVTKFCLYFTQAVHDWAHAHSEDQNVRTNLPRLMQYRNELQPYLKSVVPFIA